MKFLILALCVCAASAASFGGFNSKPQKAFAPVSAPAQVAAKAVSVVATPFVDAAAAVYQAPQVAAKTVTNYNKESEASIIRDESDVKPDGFSYGYETSNGIFGESSGVLKKVGEDAVIAVQGSYRYTSPDGIPVVFNYIADENGYQPQSDQLPVGPAIPEAILRSLEYIASKSVESAKKY